MSSSEMDWERELADFLAVSSQFKLGELVTEQPHPRTLDLSQQVQANVATAVDRLKSVDCQALTVLARELKAIQALAVAMQQCWKTGGRVFLAGCGATGRLSLALEVLAREAGDAFYQTHPVIGFMAGGDAALIKSIESFEDHPEYGERQLLELGFRAEDLLIGITEGGETPFVIGATECAARVSHRSPWFCYCNPDDLLARVAERSKRVLENASIRKLNLCVGPMALSGSTRMQASTVQMAAVGLAIFYADAPDEIESALPALLRITERIDSESLAALIECEAAVYRNREYILYRTQTLGITVLTDTTERSPTFSLAPFENRAHPQEPRSLAYLNQANTCDACSAWKNLLRRTPRCLDWEFCRSRTSLETLYGFDISDNSPRAEEGVFGYKQHLFTADWGADELTFHLNCVSLCADTEGLDLLAVHVLAKLILNTHSTLVMGLLGRYTGNLMTYVRSSNLKLIDRTIRYVAILAQQRGMPAPDYVTCARRIFALKPYLSPDEPMVLRVLDSLEL